MNSTDSRKKWFPGPGTTSVFEASKLVAKRRNISSLCQKEVVPKPSGTTSVAKRLGFGSGSHRPPEPLRVAHWRQNRPFHTPARSGSQLVPNWFPEPVWEVVPEVVPEGPLKGGPPSGSIHVREPYHFLGGFYLRTLTTFSQIQATPSCLQPWEHCRMRPSRELTARLHSSSVACGRPAGSPLTISSQAGEAGSSQPNVPPATTTMAMAWGSLMSRVCPP